MQITVIGAGATGTLYGSILQRGGADVQLFGRGPHIAAIRENGATIESDEFGRFVQKIPATDSVTEIKPAHVVIVAVPLHQLESVREPIERAARADAVVIPLSNGVDSFQRLLKMLRFGIPTYGTTIVQCEVTSPGVVRHKNKRHQITVGHPIHSVARDVVKRLSAFGLTISCTADGAANVWQMAAFRIPITVACCAHETDVGGLRKNRDVWRNVQLAAGEIGGLASRRGVTVNHGTLVFHLQRVPNGMIPSSARDVLAGINPRDTELPYLVEPLCRVSSKFGDWCQSELGLEHLLEMYSDAVGSDFDHNRVWCPNAAF